MIALRSGIVAVLIFVGAFCAGPPLAHTAESSKAPRWKVTISDNGKAITVASGSTLVVVLPATPGTGYGWVTAHDVGGHLKQIGTPDFMPQGNAMPGQAGNEIFRFEANSTGSGILEMGYVRPWEKNAVPARTFRVTVTVK